jgi:hypothetical protein
VTGALERFAQLFHMHTVTLGDGTRRHRMRDQDIHLRHLERNLDITIG